jgi:hypothetical protein
MLAGWSSYSSFNSGPTIGILVLLRSITPFASVDGRGAAFGWPLLFWGLPMRTFVYVDAFNLYYGALKRSPFRWLDLQKLCQLMLPKNNVQAIKYFTALVSERPGSEGQPLRQQLYIRALRTIPSVEIIYGHYLTHVVRMPKVTPSGTKQEYVKVIKTEEKGSDVNLATHLVHDAHLDRFDIAVVISNDSDLLSPIKLVRSELGKKVGILNPQKNPSRAILPHVDFFKQIRAGVLGDSQFPEILTDTHGTITKPASWK